MTLVISLIAVIVPSIVSILTGLLKRLPRYAQLSDSARTPAIRFLAAIIALAAVLIGEYMAGSFDTNILYASIQTVLLTAVTWFASLGIFHSNKAAV